MMIIFQANIEKKNKNTVTRSVELSMTFYFEKLSQLFFQHFPQYVQLHL